MMQRILPPLSIGRRRLAVGRWDFLAGLLVLALLVFFVVTGSKLSQPLTDMQSAPLSLDPWHLPAYAAPLRMLVALGLSLLSPLPTTTKPALLASTTQPEAEKQKPRDRSRVCA
ncbi:MAG: hypothetical protein E6Q98_03420 [Rhodospirillaceae bacterium]|nr:MAG: hypothetical protein E6Q98_03420 [Rhodospirillaceae bacterium]